MNRSPRAYGKHTKKRSSGKKPKSGSGHQDWLYGRHAVLAALKNPRRTITKVLATNNARKDFDPVAKQRDLTIEASTTSEISALLPAGAVHQGIAIQVQPLPDIGLDELPADQPILVLDQVTDPHNVGAILRSCAAFNAAAVIMTRRNSPSLTGVLAKSACGGLEYVHVIFVGNLSQALKSLGQNGYWRIGLDGDVERALEVSTPMSSKCGPVALVLGAEGKGLRRLTIENCDEVCHITTTGKLASLNVSNAAAIALHVISKAEQ